MSNTQATAPDPNLHRARYHLAARGVASRACDSCEYTRAKRDANLHSGRSDTTPRPPATSPLDRKIHGLVVWCFPLFPHEWFANPKIKRIADLRHAFNTQHFIERPHFQIIPKIHQPPRERARIFKEEAIGVIPRFGSLLFGQTMRGQI